MGSIKHQGKRAGLGRGRRRELRRSEPPHVGSYKDESGSAFIIVLWVAFGLVSLSLYFGNSMVLELRAADNRVSGLGAEQAIEGAVRYINGILGNYAAYGSNGVVPDRSGYLAEAVAVGESHFWLIGRETNTVFGPGALTFGLIDEGSKVNLNLDSATTTSNLLYSLLESMPRANQDILGPILDWRSTNGGAYSTYYSMRGQPYQSKNGPFESVDELRLVYGADMETLVGEDRNRNGVLDPNETDENKDGQVELGLLEYVTVYSREPNTTRTNASSPISTGLRSLLESALGSSRAEQVSQKLSAPPPGNLRSPLEFYLKSGMTSDEFAKIGNQITFSTAQFIVGRVNVNTASAAVLAALPGITSSPDLAQTLVNYRETNPDKLTTVAWVADALGQNNQTVLSALQANDCITTQSYQFTADIAALGPNGRGYRRVRFVFDTADGSPKIIYRQDLTPLGWALGKDVRQKWVLAKATP